MTKPDLTCRPATTMAPFLAKKLSEIGNMLKKPSFAKEYLLEILEQAVMYLGEVDQSPSDPILMSLTTPIHALVMPKILRHHDNDVRILVATCICEIMRITAPAALYSDDILKEIFELIVATFRGLDEIHSPSFGRRVIILETAAKVRLCVIMLDLQCDDLILEMFYLFFSKAREDHPENVLASMQTILTEVLNESEVISEPLSSILLSRLRRENGDISPAAYRIAMNVMKCVAIKLEPNVNLFLTSVMSAERKSENDQHNYHEIIFNIYQCAPKILRSIIPNLSQEIMSELLDVRLSAVKLLGRIFAIPCHTLAKEFQPLLSDFLKKFTDNSVEVRLATVKYAKECILSNPFRPESTGIIAALSDQLLDSDEAVRKQVIGAICDVANYALQSIPIEAIRQVADCLHDEMVSVQEYTLERLVEIYRVYCSKCLDGSVGNFEFAWIPGKILGCCYDKNFRSQVVEVAFSQSLFPSDLPLSERVKHWIAMFSEFKKPEIKAFQEVLNQKQRLQVQMQNFLSWWEKIKEEDTPELKNKILRCAKIMSGCFNDAPKVEESFIKLSQIKDNNIWKALSNLLDSSLTFVQAQSTSDYLLKQLGDGHPQYEFMKILAVRCSYLLFDKEHVREMLKEIAVNTLAGKDKIVQSSMDLLVIFARFFPSLFDGVVKDMLQLLEDDNDYIKEGVVHILAKTGCTIHEKLIETIGSLDLLLEDLCLEGSRKQAKYALQAIVALKKDFGPRVLSALYKRLIDMLESDEHLATVLQSLGCIAQTAMPIFETREDDIIQFICRKLLRKNSNPVHISKTGWDGRSKECFLKICGIKTLVRSYLPNRNAHLRQRIKALFGVLTKLITTSEISEEVQSSKVDKSHIRLAAAKAVLRLSMQWDSHINPQLFHLTIRTAQDNCPHVRKRFLAKVHRYLKDGNLHHKYACAFALSRAGETEDNLLEARQYLAEFVETCRDAQLHQPSLKSNCNSCTGSPEIVLSYLIHSLAHHPDFPVSNKSLFAEAFEPFYRQLHLFLSVILHQDRGKIHDPEKLNKLDNIPLIMTVFRTIKQMEDAVDKSKSKNIYALCDLGILIVKDFAHSQINTSEEISISLPGLYCRTEAAHLKGDGSHLPSCLGDDLLRRFKAAILFSGAQLNPDQKLCKRGAYENSPVEGKNRVNEEHFLKRSNNESDNTKEHISGRPTNPEIVIEQLDRGTEASNKSLDFGIIEASNGLDAENLESRKPLEHLEDKLKSTIIDVVPKNVRSAEYNVMSNLTKTSVLSKRKRGRPSKRMGDLASQGNGQGLLGKDSNHLKLSQSQRGHKKYLGCKQAVQTERESTDLKLASGTQGNPDEKLCNRSPYKNDCKDGLSLESEKPSKQHEEQSKRRMVEVVPNEVESAADNVMMTVAEVSALPIKKEGKPYKNGPKDTWSLETEMPSEQHDVQSKRRIVELVPNEVQSSADNVVMTVVEASVLPKRKQGRQCENGPKYGQSLMFEKASEKLGEQSKGRAKKVVTKEFKSAADNVMMTVAEASVLPRRKRGRPYKDCPRDGESLEFEKPSEQLEKQLKRRIKEVIPNEVKSSADNDMITVAEVSVHPKRKRGRPFKNGPKDGDSLEFKKPSEQDEEQSQSTIEAVLNEAKPATDNVLISVAEVSVFPKRKRGRPTKGSVDLTSQGNKQSLSGKDFNKLKSSRPKRSRTKFLGCKSDRILRSLSRAPWMHHNDQLIQKISILKQSKCLRKLDMQSSCKVERERKRKPSDAVPGKTMVAEVNFTFTDVETKASSKSKERCPHKESPEFPSPDQQQFLLERPEGLKLSQCRGGHPKGSGKRPDSKEKLKLPDSTIMAIEKVSDSFSRVELTPNYQPSEKNNVSAQKVAKSSNKRLDDNHNELEETIEKNPLGDQNHSIENETLDPKSEISCLHTKNLSNRPDSPEKVSNEDGNNHKGTPRKLLRSKIFSGLEKKPANQQESSEKGLNEDENNNSGTPRNLLRSQSFSAVEKSTSQNFENEIGEELVGHRIKVWWPLDKKFYVGVVESYDLEYRRHKVIYRDGDVEVLRLGREQWELIEGSPLSKKVMRTAVESATSNGETSLYKTRSKSGLESVNSSAHDVLKQRSTACSSESEKRLAERTAGCLVFTDANAPVCSKGHRQEKQGSEGRKVRRQAPLIEPIRRVLRSDKETKEKRNRSDYKRRGGLAVA